jgi:hypothetical protein
MPFTRLRRFLSTVAIKSIDRDQIRKAVASFATQIRKHHPEVERVIWFGSWVNGLPTPGSDVDLCLILHPINPQDRIRITCPSVFRWASIFACTNDEFERLRISSPGWYAAIISAWDIIYYGKLTSSKAAGWRACPGSFSL